MSLLRREIFSKNIKLDKILIIAPHWLGDLVVSHSLVQYLKKHRPDCSMDVMVPESLLPVLERMPGVDRVIPTSFQRGRLQLFSRYRLARRLQQAHYHQVIVLPNSYKSALVPYWAHIPRRTGWVGEYRYGILNDIRRCPGKSHRSMTIAEQFVSLGSQHSSDILGPIDQPLLKSDSENIDRVLTKLKLTVREPLLILCPGAAFGPAKQWFSEYYAAVANRQLERGWQVWILGAPADKGVADHIVALTRNRSVNLVGATDLGEAIDLMSLASVVISNDSGLMHVGAALDRPLIAIYGSSSPRYTPPLSKKATIIQTNVECHPCFKRKCDLSPKYYMQCMRSITPSIVWEHIDRFKC